MLTVKYAKLDSSKFLSHLDMQTILQRTIKRAGFTPVFTQGFNPRPIFKMSKPLPLGVASKCEYFSVNIHNVNKKNFIKSCAMQTPQGIEFLDAWVTEKDPKVFNLGIISEYEIVSNNLKYNDFNIIKEKISSSFIVPKKHKRQYIVQDVSNLIVDLSYRDDKMVVCLMSTASLNLRINDFLNGINMLFSIDVGINNVMKTNQYINHQKISVDTYLSEIEQDF